MHNAACSHSHTHAYTHTQNTHAKHTQNTHTKHTRACRHTIAGIVVGGIVLVIAVGGVIIVMGYIHTRRFTHPKGVSHCKYRINSCNYSILSRINFRIKIGQP